MVWFLYNILFAIGFLLMLPRFLVRMARRGGYARDFTQRFARYSPSLCARLDESRRVWLHAVSVGEMLVALKLMQEWRERRPDLRFVVTTTTSTAYKLAGARIDARDVLLYFPLDLPWIIRRALNEIDPLAIVLVELELWPNLVRMAHQRSVPVILVNGRISDHSFQGYRKLTFFTRRLLPMIDLFCVQTRFDAERLISLGAPSQRVRVLGTAKYDVASQDLPGETVARAVLDRVSVTPHDLVIVGGSTWPGEEHALLDAYKGLKTRYRNLFLVLAPRHAERAPAVLQEIRASAMKVVRRSELADASVRVPQKPQVLLLDTTGELANFYACADVIFIGKSLTARGGQNPIEAAILGKPIVIGKNTENFRAVVDDLRTAGALIEVTDLQSLRRGLDDLCSNPNRRKLMGENAARVVHEKAGSIGKTLALLDPMLDDEPIPPPTYGRS